MIRTIAIAALLFATAVAFGGATPFAAELATDTAASCIHDVTDGEGCVRSPVPVPCRPFEDDKYLRNLDVCLM